MGTEILGLTLGSPSAGPSLSESIERSLGLQTPLGDVAIENHLPAFLVGSLVPPERRRTKEAPRQVPAN